MELSNNKIKIIQLNENTFSLIKESTPYSISFSCKENCLNIRIKRQLSPVTYEGIFTLKEFLELNKIFFLFDNLEDIYQAIKKQFIENNVSISEKEDVLDLSINFDLNFKKQLVTLKIPKNTDFNVNLFLEDMSNTILQLSEKIKSLEISKFYPGSSILKIDEVDLINEWLGGNIMFTLLYKASVHGDRAADFHNKCDNKGPTISFIENSMGKRFGGYTALSWDSSNTTKTNDLTAFIFSLDHKRKYKCSNQSNVIYCNSSYNVTFGGGHDIYIADYIGSTGSYSNFPHSYGSGENFPNRAQTYLSGSYHYTVKEVEVYSVIKNK